MPFAAFTSPSALRISHRIYLMLLLPFLGALAFSSMVLIGDWKRQSDANAILTIGTIAPKISALVHEMQKERGMSAGFISSKGTKFGDALRQQRAMTDQNHAVLAQAFATFDVDSYDAALASKIESATAALTPLAEKRQQVSRFEFTVPQMAAYYTPTITKLLAVIEEMAVIASNGEVANAITAYTLILQAKERSGIERAMGAAGFGAGKFAPPVYRNFVRLIAMQDILNKTFANYATPEQLEFFKSTMSGPAVDNVNRLRKIAIESPQSGNTGGIEAGQWFKTITEKIGLYKTVEDRLAIDLIDMLKSIKSAATWEFIIISVIVAGMMLATVATAIILIRGIVGPIATTTENMNKLAAGNTDIEIHGTERQDEIGDMARSMTTLREEVSQSFKLGQMVEDMPMNVMMCDVDDFKFTYVNKSTTTTLKTLEQLLPCKVDELLGNSIDIFYENADEQRNILSDPSNLPHSANIKLGDEHLSIKFSAIRNKAGDYAGPMMAWSVITEQMNISEKVADVVRNVSAAATQMRSTAESMSATAEETSRQASAAAAASEQTTANVQTVASASEEMSASIREIDRQVKQSTEIAVKANTEAERTNETVQSLVNSGQKIGEVVNLISEIAEQTNLLALNATIEAARAGEAGKGFAVVASEVKNLANQTAKATEEIGGQITEMQSVTNDAVDAINSIGKTIGEINSIAETIANAVGEQGTATQEISENTQQAASGTQDVSNNITGVNQAASETGAAAQQVLSAADELAKQGETLSMEVEAFIAHVKAS